MNAAGHENVDEQTSRDEAATETNALSSCVSYGTSLGRFMRRLLREERDLAGFERTNAHGGAVRRAESALDG
jgi:hypothetical protein